MINVLHVMGFADAGGISAVVLNYYTFIDRERFHFDIALTGGKPGMLGKILQSKGVIFYQLPLKSKGIKEYQEALYALLKNKSYDAIHVHAGGTAYIDLMVARKCGIPVRIAHAHSAGISNSFRTRIRFLASVFLNPIFATKLIACGKLAGNRTYGKKNMCSEKGLVIPNAIDCSRFAFDPIMRDQIRGELGISDRYVIGMVGRLSNEKNHQFALQIINELKRTLPECILLIMGVGEEQNTLVSTMYKLGIENNVLFLGRKSDIERYYQAFDVLILPSLSEGFPVAAVEGLASGLPVLLSDRITNELSAYTEAYYLPLEVVKWVDMLKELNRKNDTLSRVRWQREVKENGLDIHDAVRLLEKVYSE